MTVEHGRRAAQALLDATESCDGAFLKDARQRTEQWLATLPADGAELHEYKAQAVSDGREPIMLLMVETDWVKDNTYWRLDAGVHPHWGIHDRDWL